MALVLGLFSHFRSEQIITIQATGIRANKTKISINRIQPFNCMFIYRNIFTSHQTVLTFSNNKISAIKFQRNKPTTSKLVWESLVFQTLIFLLSTLQIGGRKLPCRSIFFFINNPEELTCKIVKKYLQERKCHVPCGDDFPSTAANQH
jgi:hypothetical protein